MEEFISYVTRNLVDSPEDVQVSVYAGSKSSVVEIKVAQKDVAKLVGRQGRTINALRSIVSTLGARLGLKVRVEVV